MRIKVTEEQLQTIVNEHSRTHARLRRKTMTSAPAKEYAQTIVKPEYIREKELEEGPLDKASPKIAHRTKKGKKNQPFIIDVPGDKIRNPKNDHPGITITDDKRSTSSKKVYKESTRDESIGEKMTKQIIEDKTRKPCPDQTCPDGQFWSSGACMCLDDNPQSTVKGPNRGKTARRKSTVKGPNRGKTARRKVVREEHDCAKAHPDTSHDEWAQLNEEELTEEFYQHIKENNIAEDDINEERLDEFFKMRACVSALMGEPGNMNRGPARRACKMKSMAGGGGSEKPTAAATRPAPPQTKRVAEGKKSFGSEILVY